MHKDDIEVIVSVLAAERSAAVTAKWAGSVWQVERLAVQLAAAFSGRDPRFDPIRFVLAVCGAADDSQLPAKVRAELVRQFGTTTRRPRQSSMPPMTAGPVDTSRWHPGILVGAVLHDVSPTQTATTTKSALVDAGIHTLGELAARSEAQIMAVNRVGPKGMRIIREVLLLWRAKSENRGGHNG